MGLEAASFINDLVIANPPGTDGKSQGDDHLRLLKTVLKNTFPGSTAGMTFDLSTLTDNAMVLLSTETGAAEGPSLFLRRTGTLSANHEVGGVFAYGKNAAAAEKLFGWIAFDAPTLTAGSEEGRVELGIIAAGAAVGVGTFTKGVFTLAQNAAANTAIIQSNALDTFMELRADNAATGARLFLHGSTTADGGNATFFDGATQTLTYDRSTSQWLVKNGKDWTFENNTDVRFGTGISVTPAVANDIGAAFSTNGARFEISNNGASVNINSQSNSATIQFMRSGITVGSISVTTLGTSFNEVSDARLKADFKPFDAWEILKNIEVGKYRHKLSGEIGYGVLAQDTLPFFPQAVHYNKESGYYELGYSKYMPLVMSEVKALHRKVEELERKLQ